MKKIICLFLALTLTLCAMIPALAEDRVALAPLLDSQVVARQPVSALVHHPFPDRADVAVAEPGLPAEFGQVAELLRLPLRAHGHGGLHGHRRVEQPQTYQTDRCDRG